MRTAYKYKPVEQESRRLCLLIEAHADFPNPALTRSDFGLLEFDWGVASLLSCSLSCHMD